MWGIGVIKVKEAKHYFQGLLISISIKKKVFHNLIGPARAGFKNINSDKELSLPQDFFSTFNMQMYTVYLQEENLMWGIFQTYLVQNLFFQAPHRICPSTHSRIWGCCSRRANKESQQERKVNKLQAQSPAMCRIKCKCLALPSQLGHIPHLFLHTSQLPPSVFSNPGQTGPILFPWAFFSIPLLLSSWMVSFWNSTSFSGYGSKTTSSIKSFMIP